MKEMYKKVGNFFNVFNYDETIAKIVLKLLFGEPGENGALFEV